MPNKNGYPTEEELKKIKELKNVSELLNHLKSIWWMPDWGFVEYWGFTSFPIREKALKLELHTGGWSGNEDIIRGLQKTDFWILFWVRSERGGHYCFEIPKRNLSDKAQ
jgi:hypothetical protein